jgi:hypothetical protein
LVSIVYHRAIHGSLKEAIRAPSFANATEDKELRRGIRAEV